MPKRRRCAFCRRLFSPDPRVKERQKTCGRQACRKRQKRSSNERWRSEHPHYFQGVYSHQKAVYGTRAHYKKGYRREHPEYVRRNAVYVRAYRDRLKKVLEPVSPTSCDLRLSFSSPTTSLRVAQVSHTSREIFVTVCQPEIYPKTAAVSPTSFDSA